MEQVSDEVPMSAGRLRTMKKCIEAFAEDLRGATGDERALRGCLLAVASAIHNNRLPSLLDHLVPWMRRDLAEYNALTQAEQFDRASRWLIEAAQGADADDLDALHVVEQGYDIEPPTEAEG